MPLGPQTPIDRLPATGFGPGALPGPTLPRAVMEAPPRPTGFGPRPTVFIGSDLPERPLRDRDLGTAEAIAAGLFAGSAVLGPAQVLRALKTVAPLILPLSLQEYYSFQLLKKSHRVESLLEHTRDRILGTENLNPKPPPDPFHYPTPGALIINELLGEAGHTFIGELVRLAYGAEPQLPAPPPPGPLTPAQLDRVYRAILASTDAELAAHIRAQSDRSDLSAQQRAVLAFIVATYAQRLGIYAARGWIGQLGPDGSQPVGDKADP